MAWDRGTHCSLMTDVINKVLVKMIQNSCEPALTVMSKTSWSAVEVSRCAPSCRTMESRARHFSCGRVATGAFGRVCTRRLPSQFVGDQSEYVSQIVQVLKTRVTTARQSFKHVKHFRTFCMKFAECVMADMACTGRAPRLTH